MIRPIHALGRTTLAGALLAAAACGGAAKQSADSARSDTTGTLGAPVGTNKPASDSAFSNAQGTLDSLHAAGVTTKNGIDSVAGKIQTQTANEPVHDTSHLNNKATPPGQRSPAQRP